MNVLLDTGAMKSVISNSFINKYKLWDLAKPSKIKLSGIGGKEISNLGSIFLPIEFPNCAFNCKMEFLIVPSDKPLVLLGVDFCIDFKCDILFSRNILRGPKLLAPIFWHNGGNEIHNIHAKNETSWYHHVKPCIVKNAFFHKNVNKNFKKTTTSQNTPNNKQPKEKKFTILAQNDISIPACSQSLVYFKLHKSVFDQIKGKEVLFEPKSLTKVAPVLLAKQLILIRSQKIPLLCLNMGNQNFTWKRHKMLGTFQIISQAFQFEPYVPTSTHNDLFSITSTEGLSEETMKRKIAEIKSQEPWISELQIGNISVEQEYQVMLLLKQFHMVFSKNKYDIGKSNLIEIKLNVETSKPVYTRQYPLDRQKREILEQEVQKMRDMDLIEETNSPFNSPLVIVQKADGSHRVVTDFRKLNTHIPSEIQTLPTLEETLEVLGGKSFFSNLDLMTAFQQCPLAKESRPYTAATAGLFRFQYKVLPYGLKNASSQFQGMMNALLGSMQFKNAIIYIDDVLIMSKTFSEHLSNLAELFSKLKSSNLKLKPKKCNLLKDQINYLGHIIMKDGIIPCENKIKAILEIDPPRNAKSIKSFLGLCSYFRRYVPDFSSLAAPLINLTKPSVKFQWTALENESFQKLKSLLVNPPILVHPDMNRKFIVTADASSYGVGGILSQLDDDGNERAVSYMSKKLTPAQSNYCATDLELLACITALNHFKPYLIGNKFKLITDHRPILYLLNMKNPSAKHYRYILQFQQFDFEVEHRSGILNGGADALSRNPQFLDSLHKLKNKNINYMRNLLVKPEQIENWKSELCNEFNLVMNNVKDIVVTEYNSFCADSVYEQVAKLLSNDVTQSNIIRDIVHFHVVRNRKYFEKSDLLESQNFIDHAKGIKSGKPASLLDIKTIASILKLPILLKENDREDIIFGSIESKTRTFPPLGAAILLEKDKFDNWVWRNVSLDLPKIDIQTKTTTTKNQRNAIRKGKEQGDKILSQQRIDDVPEPVQVNSIHVSKEEKCKTAQQNLKQKLSDKTHLRIYAVRKASEIKPSSLYIPTAKEIVQCQERDAYCSEWLNFLRNNIKPKFKKQFFKKYENQYKINEEGVLVYIPTKGVRRGELPPKLIVVPLNLFKFIMEATHVYLSHIGREKTMYIVSQSYHRPGLKGLISKYVYNCALCENKKANRKLKPAHVQRVAPVKDRLTCYSLDVVGPLPLTARRNKYIVSVIDHFSRWVELVAVNNIRTQTIIDKVLMDLIARFGCPERIHTDRAQNFLSNLMKQFCKSLKIKRTMTSGLHPQSNGILEVTHKFLGNCLKLTVQSNQKNWDQLLPQVLLAYRSTNHTSLNENPAWVLYGRDLRLPTQLLPTKSDNIDDLDEHHMGNKVAIQFAETKKIYQQVMEKQTTKSRTFANRNRITRQVKIGDTVLMRKPLDKAKLSPKLHKQFVGEYRVIEKIGNVNYVVQEKNGSRKFTVHIDRIIHQDPQFKIEYTHWADQVADIMDKNPQEDEDDDAEETHDIDALWQDESTSEDTDIFTASSLDEFTSREYN